MINRFCSEPYQYIDGLYDINEDLVLLVFDPLRPPGHCVGHGGWHLGLCHLQFGAFLSDVSVSGELIRVFQLCSDTMLFDFLLYLYVCMCVGLVLAHSCKILLSVV